MNTYLINGDKCLSGKIKVDGSKNALLPILAAACVSKSIVTLNNVPNLQDTISMIGILKYLNVKVIYDNKSRMIIDARFIKNRPLKIKEVSKLRASYYFMGALLSLFNKVEMATPGGCNFSDRPIDLHLYAFSHLGVSYTLDGEVYHLKKTSKIKNTITFNKNSVGATINAILASIRIKETIVIKNGAKEPEVDDLICFLNKCGANIVRNKDEILIKGTNNLCGCNYCIIDDRIEAQTYLTIGALLGKKLKIEYKNKEHITAFIKLFKDLKIDVKEYEKGYIINKKENIEAMDLNFDVYPFLPTDIQPILSILFTKCKKESVFKDNVYPSRYSQINELNSMGFNMKIYGEKLIIRKNNSYLESEVYCKDLRGGMSLIVGALISNKKTTIKDIHLIKRGYSNLFYKLKEVGANIEEL